MTKTKISPVEVVADHHYFASTFCSWAVAATRAEAIAKCAKIAGDSIIKANVKANGGLYVWTCRVDVPDDKAHNYHINNYAPAHFHDADGKPDKERPVPISSVASYAIVNTKGHVIPSESEDNESVEKRLRRALIEARCALRSINVEASKKFDAAHTLSTEWEDGVTNTTLKLYR